MKIIPFAVIALMLAPTIAAAQGCKGDRKEASMSCAEGATWNSVTKTCEITSS
ncbi:MAG: hypothetical protein WCC57_18145 [Paracoccaceae bacterium]